MTQKEAEWQLELEESAQGTDLFEAPGAEVQAEQAREDAVEPIADPLGAGNSTPRVETVRATRHSLAKTMTDLESAVTSPAFAAGWWDAVAHAIDELGAALEEHISATESKNGLLAEILDQAPRLAMELGLIEEEHAGLEESLAQAQLTLRGAMEIGCSDPEPSRSRVMTLLGRLSLHRQRGADLVYEAYNVDIASVD
jgi:hypothetical protein